MDTNLGIVVVEVCDNNYLSNIDIESMLENEFPEVSVLNLDCLNLCGLCSMRPFAMVNGKRVFAKTIEDCFEKIRTKIINDIDEFNDEINED